MFGHLAWHLTPPSFLLLPPNAQIQDVFTWQILCVWIEGMGWVRWTYGVRYPWVSYPISIYVANDVLDALGILLHHHYAGWKVADVGRCVCVPTSAPMHKIYQPDRKTSFSTKILVCHSSDKKQHCWLSERTISRFWRVATTFGTSCIPKACTLHLPPPLYIQA